MTSTKKQVMIFKKGNGWVVAKYDHETGEHEEISTYEYPFNVPDQVDCSLERREVEMTHDMRKNYKGCDDEKLASLRVAMDDFECAALEAADIVGAIMSKLARKRAELRARNWAAMFNADYLGVRTVFDRPTDF